MALEPPKARTVANAFGSRKRNLDAAIDGEDSAAYESMEREKKKQDDDAQTGLPKPSMFQRIKKESYVWKED